MLGAVLSVLPHESFSSTSLLGPRSRPLQHMALLLLRYQKVNPWEEEIVYDSPKFPQRIAHYLERTPSDELSGEWMDRYIYRLVHNFFNSFLIPLFQQTSQINVQPVKKIMYFLFKPTSRQVPEHSTCRWNHIYTVVKLMTSGIRQPQFKFWLCYLPAL